MLAYAKNWSVLSVVVGLAFAVAVVKGDTCKPSVKGATWDFSALKDTLYVTGGDMECTYNKEEKSYQYAFSPCGNAAVDSKCKATAHCPLGGAINSMLPPFLISHFPAFPEQIGKNHALPRAPCHLVAFYQQGVRF